MIREIQPEELSACVQVIRDSFATVALEFGFTQENASRFTAFATTLERLEWHYYGEHRPMYGFYREDTLVGYYSLLKKEEDVWELNNLCVLPEYRHEGIGPRLLAHAMEIARGLSCRKMVLSLVEENQVLRNWYEKYGFVHTGREKFDFFPFTCGYMEKVL